MQVDLSCGELAELVDGQLTLAAMPPLGGRWEPAGRIVTDSGQLTPGDLYWALDRPGRRGADHLEEAYCRGAMGVVAARRAVAPWAGCFAIGVDHAGDALCRLARAVRSRFEGRVVAMIGPDLQPAATLLQRTLQGKQAELPHTESLLASPPSTAPPPTEPHSIDPVQRAALTLLPLSCERQIPSYRPQASGRRLDRQSLRLTGETQKLAVLRLAADSLEEIDEISHLCCPHVACINPLPRAGHAVATDVSSLTELLLSGLPDDGRLVMAVVDQPPPAVSGPVLTVGFHPACSLQADVRARRGDVWEVDLQGVVLSVPGPWLPAVLSAWGVAHAVQLDARVGLLEACRRRAA